VNAVLEGSSAQSADLTPTTLVNNVTQILRKVVQVSDTANVTANYGRGKELQYQMEKKGKEIKRDLEFAFLNNVANDPGDSMTARKTAGFTGLTAPIFVDSGGGVPADPASVDPDTGAIVHKTVATPGTLDEDDLFDLTYQLYLAGSNANIIMFHPSRANFFSALQERSSADGAGGGNRQRIFENTEKFAKYVSIVVDPLTKLAA
jgi:hypothetical protein